MSEEHAASARGEEEPSLLLPDAVSDDDLETGQAGAPEATACGQREALVPDPIQEPRREPPTAGLSRGDISAALQAPFVQPILRFPLRKVVIWGSLLGLLYLASEFFSVILLTFVISYMSVTVVDRMTPVLKRRKLSVFLVYLVIVGALVGLGYSIVPGALDEGKKQIERVKQIKDPNSFIQGRVEALLEAYPVLQGWGFGERVQDALSEEEAFKDIKWKEVLERLGGVWAIVWKGFLNVGVALIFSFMIVWDMPKMQQGLGRLKESRLAAVWSEVGPSIGTFFRLLGRAFEAQTVIAIVNTALTCVGMSILGIEAIGFLAGIVFVCSFIPVVGVFLSTVPICVMALQGGGGLGTVLGVVVLVTLIHLIEAYVLNPRIYGHHMRLHPLAVLVVLYLAQALMGVWGLVVGVPVATYIWRHLIMGQAEGPAFGEEEDAVAQAVGSS